MRHLPVPAFLSFLPPLCGVLLFGGSARGELPPQLAAAVKQLASIDAVEVVEPAHRMAWVALAGAPPVLLPELLRAIEGENLIAENWLTSAADAIASDAIDRGETLPIDELDQLVRDQRASSRGRRVAFEWIRKIEPERADKLLDNLRDDPNLDIRYDAVAKLIALIKETPKDNASREALVRQALAAARDVDQIKVCCRELEEYGETIDLAQHLGFVTAWRLIGPFDNARSKGFDAVYPPETEIDFSAGYLGKTGPVAWREELVTTEDEMGDIDINEVVGPLKGAIVYLYAELESPEARRAEARYASTNATKLWVNGVQVGEHEVYHAGNQYDQYIHPVELLKGKNRMLLKVCQNEQTDSTAQGWQFMLRLTDKMGASIPLKNVTPED